MSAAAHSQGYSSPEISWLNFGGKDWKWKDPGGCGSGCFQQEIIGRTTVIYSPLLSNRTWGFSVKDSYFMAEQKRGGKVVVLNLDKWADRVCVSPLSSEPDMG